MVGSGRLDLDRGHSSAGRAVALQASGRRFDPVWLHHPLRYAREIHVRREQSFQAGLNGSARIARA